MSSSRINFPQLRIRDLIQHAVPYWICVIICFSTAFLVVILTLRQHEQEKARHLLCHYQAIYQQNGSSGLQMSYTVMKDGNSSFMRLEGSDQRLILLNNDGRDDTGAMPDFSSFPKTSNQVWHSLQSGSSIGSWTVASALLADGNTLQIGMNSSESLSTLRGIGRVLFKMALPCLLLCFVPAWYTLRRNGRVIRNLTSEILAVSSETDQLLQVERERGSDETGLINAVKLQMTRHQRLTRELQESMDNVAHDLRTPVTRLRAIAEYGLHKGEDTEHLREALADCLEESDQLLSMLNTMLNVAEAEADTVKLDLQPVSLAESISGVLDLYAIIAEEQGTVINFDSSPELFILADRQRISQAWANLVDNAIKYNSSEITITTRQQGSRAEIQIQDNGMGISENEINRIWNRLFRGDRSRSKPGLGLGLTLVRATINSHNGTIDVSSGLNSGTVFTVSLPIAEIAQQQT